MNIASLNADVICDTEIDPQCLKSPILVCPIMNHTESLVRKCALTRYSASQREQSARQEDRLQVKNYLYGPDPACRELPKKSGVLTVTAETIS